MNVLHIISAKTWGGGETAALTMCKTLQESGYGVYIVLDGNNTLLKEKFAGVGCIKCIRMRWTESLSCIIELRRFIKENEIKAVHTHTGRVIPMVLIAILGLDVKCIAYRHNVIQNKKDIIHRMIYKNISAFVCVSNCVRKSQEKDMPQWMRNKIYVVHNGVDIHDEYFSECMSIKKRKDKFTIGYAGRIVENKGLLWLVKAFCKMDNDSVLKIAGDDSTEYAARIKSYLKQRKCERVEWLGYIGNMKEFYKQIDTMVCPSIVAEAFGLSICEAMYYGIPVIASNNGAQGEIIEDEVDGFLVDSGDIDEIANKLCYLKDNYEIRVELGKNTHNKIKRNFTTEMWIKKMQVVYDEIFDERKGVYNV